MHTGNVIYRPFSLRPKQMEDYFGLKERHVNDLVNSGHLRRGVHYLKAGRITVIIVEKFIEWLEDQDHGSTKKRQMARY